MAAMAGVAKLVLSLHVLSSYSRKPEVNCAYHTILFSFEL